MNSSRPPCWKGYEGMKDGDGFFCLNFRADRAREILRAIGEPGFAEFETGPRPKLAQPAGHGGIFRQPQQPI